MSEAPRNVKNLLDQKFHRLTVVGFSSVINRKAQWDCLCECGEKATVASTNLLTNTTKSCGCLNRETSLNNIKGVTKPPTHGMYGTPTYYSWAAMHTRCTNPNRDNYKYYGGRGIKVCERWDSFESFYEDMGKRPESKTIDRIDNDGDYTLDNCKWSTHKEQINNRRKRVNG